MIRLAAPLCAGLLLTALPAAAQLQNSPLPPQGGPGVFSEGQARAAALAASARTTPGLAIGPVLVTERYQALDVRRGAAGPPAIHPGWSELHYILDGAGVMVTGGRIVPGANGTPAAIQGGVTQAVKKGDAVMVPPDTPHQYVSVHGSVTTLEVRFVDAAAPK